MSPRAAARLELLGFGEVFEYTAGKHDWLAAGLPTEGEEAGRPRAMTFARTDVPVCAPSDRMGDVDRSHGVAVVVTRDRVVLGLLREGELAGDPEARVEDVMVCGPSTFRPNVPIKELADYMTRHDLESSPITTSDGRLVGVLFREDAVRAAG
jgi:CBS domain-containing protein